MLYQWKIPELFNVSAQAAGAEIASCIDHDGLIRAEAVVEKARSATSVIHGCFEWDDERAAVQYRLRQAGALIRNIVTVQMDDDNRLDTPVRAFVNIKGDSERGYKTISTVVRSDDDYAYLLESAKKELLAFTQKYAVLSELRAVMSAIQEVVS